MFFTNKWANLAVGVVVTVVVFVLMSKRLKVTDASGVVSTAALIKIA